MSEEVRKLVQQHTDTNANEEPEIERKSCLLIKNSFQCFKVQKHIKELFSKCSDFKYPTVFSFSSMLPLFKAKYTAVQCAQYNQFFQTK